MLSPSILPTAPGDASLLSLLCVPTTSNKLPQGVFDITFFENIDIYIDKVIIEKIDIHNLDIDIDKDKYLHQDVAYIWQIYI